jgi:hypothetical protein
MKNKRNEKNEQRLSNAQQLEWEAWKEMCKAIQTHFNITDIEFNKPEVKQVVAMIERWAYYDRLRRDELRLSGHYKKYADDKGLFWMGD